MSNFFRFMWGLPQFTFPSRTELSGRPLRCLDHDVDAQRPWHIFFVAEVSRVNGPMFLGWITGIYPLVNKHRPWQIEVGRLVSIKNGWFSGSMLIYWRVIVYFVSFWNVLGTHFLKPSCHVRSQSCHLLRGFRHLRCRHRRSTPLKLNILPAGKPTGNLQMLICFCVWRMWRI